MIRTIVLAAIAALAPALRAEEVQGLILPLHSVAVATPVQDVVREIFVEEGDTVTEGQRLARLRDTQEMLEIQRIERLIAMREFAAKGMSELLKEKMVSREAAMEKQTELDLAKAEREIVKERLEEKTIKSPLDGIVVKKHKEPGEAVERVATLFDIVNIDQVYAQFYLDPKWMARTAVGQRIPVRIPVLGDAPEFDGVVSFVDPRIDAASGLFRVKVLIDNPRHEIKAGMRASADFEKAVAAR